MAQQVRCDLGRIQEIVKLNHLARIQGVKFLLFGPSVTDFIHSSRVEILRKEQEGHLSRSISLREFLPRTPKLEIGIQYLDSQSPTESNGRAHQIAACQLLNKTCMDLGAVDLGSFPADAIESLKFRADVPILDIQTGEMWGGDSTLNRAGDLPVFLRSLSEGELKFEKYSESLRPAWAKSESSRPYSDRQYLLAMDIIAMKTKYGLGIEDRLFQEIKSIFATYSPQSVHPKTRIGLEEVGLSIFENGLDLEDSWNILNNLGLLVKLSNSTDDQTPHTFSYFANKEPLRSFPYPGVKGTENPSIFFADLTARGLGISLVTHQTNVDAARSITSHPANKVNAFISRRNFPGESALRGAGFYTSVGTSPKMKRGEKNIVLELAPSAVQNDHFVVSKNAVTSNFCRLLTSDPNLVRVVNPSRRLLYRPQVLHSKFQISKGEMQKPNFGIFGRVVLKLFKYIKK